MPSTCETWIQEPDAVFPLMMVVCAGACGTNFRTRLRLLHHLTDARRTHCRDVFNSGTETKLSNERGWGTRWVGQSCFCETEWAFACDCTVASLEFEWTCSWKVDLLSVNHACLTRVESFLVTSAIDILGKKHVLSPQQCCQLRAARCPSRFPAPFDRLSQPCAL